MRFIPNLRRFLAGSLVIITQTSGAQILHGDPPAPPPPTLEQRVNRATHIFIGTPQRLAFMGLDSLRQPEEYYKELVAPGAGRVPILVLAVKEVLYPAAQGTGVVRVLNLGDRTPEAVREMLGNDYIFLARREEISAERFPGRLQEVFALDGQPLLVSQANEVRRAVTARLRREHQRAK
jgi:hypothetical protein